MDPEATLGGSVVAVCVGDERGAPKVLRDRIDLMRGGGALGDAHGDTGHRQVSLLADEGMPLLRARGVETTPGVFGENLRTRGLDLSALTEGRRVRVGDRAVLQVTERARVAGAAEGGDGVAWLFARVVRSGPAAPGDALVTDPSFDRPRFAVVTLSDRSASGARPDASGALAASILAEALRAPPLATDVLPDDAGLLRRRLMELADEELCDLIVTTGGTGLSPRDVTPEATLAVIDRPVPGVAEAIRAGGLAKTPFAMLSRGVCGQRGSTLIVNLSGSPKAVREQLAILLPVLGHVLATASGVPQDCAALVGDAHP